MAAGVRVNVKNWPFTLSSTQPSGREVTLRPLESGDRGEWERIRREDAAWLQPWEAGTPHAQHSELPFRRLRRALTQAAREGRVLPFVVDVDGTLIGQMQVFDIVWGSRCSGTIGYWLARSATGKGIATHALAMVIDFALGVYGLNRVEVNVRPENTASLAVVRRLGLESEALRRELVYVDGAWRDHHTFAVTRSQMPPSGFIGQLAAGDSARPGGQPPG